MQQALSGSQGKLAQWLGSLRGELVVLTLAAILSIAVHAHFKVTGFGETDAARLARDAIGWHLQGYVSPEAAGYTERTSALYLRLEKALMDHGLAIRLLPLVMNWFSVVLGTGCSLALYALFRLLKGPRIAAAATVVHALTPGFWSGNVYGMPTVPGLFLFVLALIAFLLAVRTEELRSLRFGLLVALALGLLFLALGFKADLALATGAFLAVALTRPERRWPLIGASALVVVCAVGGIVAYGRLVVSGQANSVAAGESTISFLQTWNRIFPFKTAALLTDSNNTTIVRCVGGLLFGVIVLALIYGWITGGALRREASLAALWGLPPILMWGFQFDDSSRHNIPAFPPLVFFAVIFVFHICAGELRRALPLLAALMFVNYFSNTSGNGSIVPQSDLAGLSEKIEGVTSGYHDKAREIAADPAPKRLVLYASEDPYVEYEVLARAQHPQLKMGLIWELTDGPQITHFFFSRDRNATRNIVRDYKRDGFAILSISRY